MRTLYALAACMVLQMVATAPVRAAVFFEFTITETTPATAPIRATGWLALTDEAYAAGIRIAKGHSYNVRAVSPFGWWEQFGIAWFDFRIVGVPQGPGANVSSGPLLIARPPDFRDYGISSDAEPFWSVVLESSPFGTPAGLIAFNNSLMGFQFDLQGTASGGFFGADGGPEPCGEAPLCGFTGRFELSDRSFPIIEPGALCLFGVGLASLARMRRRQKPKGH